MSTPHEPTTDRDPRIILLGAGFAGLYTAKQLAQSMRGTAEVVLIDPKDTFLFTPRLIDLLEDESVSSKAVFPLAPFTERHGIRFIQAHAEGIDRNEKTIRLRHADGHIETLAYDVAAICIGSKPSFRNIKGAEEYSIPLKTKEDVERIHLRVRQQFEAARRVSSDPERRALLSFITIGAGAAGVEALTALTDFTHALAKNEHPELEQFVSFAILQAGPQILPGFSLPIVDGATEELRRRGVFVYTGDPVVAMSPNIIETAQGRRIPAGLIIWSAGIETCGIEITPPVQRDPSQSFSVDRYLRIDPALFAAGDAVLYREKNQVIPKNAQTAMLMATTLAKNIEHILHSKPLTPFHYVSKGSLLLVGETGFIDLRFGSIRSRLTRSIRDLFYWIRAQQLTR